MKTKGIIMDELKEGYNKILLIVKILALISALALLIVFWTIPKTDCDKCSFNGESAEKFMGEYYEECINHPLAQSFPLNPQNPHN